MKIAEDIKAFRPIVITIESALELQVLQYAIGLDVTVTPPPDQIEEVQAKVQRAQALLKPLLNFGK